jgi:hypothetical protein
VDRVRDLRLRPALPDEDERDIDSPSEEDRKCEVGNERVPFEEGKHEISFFLEISLR